MSGNLNFVISCESRQFNLEYDPSIVLPPDEATVSMAKICATSVRLAKAAQQLYEPTDPSQGRVVRAVDLGSGSGIIGVSLQASLPELTDLVSIDIDPATLAIARRNINSANQTRRLHGLGDVACTHMVGDWGDTNFWGQLGSADLTISNPPYLLPGEEVRGGYEQTPKAHLYAESVEHQTRTYRDIIANAVANMRVWDVLGIRLPKSDLRGEPSQFIREAYGFAMSGAEARGDQAYYSMGSWHYRSNSSRPLHILTLEKLPPNFPALNLAGDVRLDKYIRTGKDVGPLVSAPKREPNEANLITHYV